MAAIAPANVSSPRMMKEAGMLKWGNSRSFRVSIGSFADIAAQEQPAREHDVWAQHEKRADQPPRKARRQKSPDSGGDQIDQGHGQHELPGEVHQLIHSQARQCATHTNENRNQRE